MLNIANNLLCEVIAEKYGYKPQARQAVEEMSELIQAICKLDRNHGDFESVEEIATAPEYIHVAEEIADVKICIAQLEYLLDCKGLVGLYVDEKLKRQVERIEKNNG